LRRAWWMIAAVVAALSCGTSGGGKVGPGSDGGTGGTLGDGGTGGGVDAGNDGGPGGPSDGGVIPGGPDGGAPDGGGGGSGFTTISWSQLAERPLGTSEAAGEIVGGKFYTFGGFNWGPIPCCTPWRYAFVYDPAANRWSRLADMPEGVTHAGTTTDGTDVFYAGGFVEDASRTYQIFGTRHVWRYRIATDTYEAMPDLPDSRGAGALVYLDGKLHFFGGESFGQGHDTPEHWVLDLAGGGTSWIPAAPMLPGRARNHLGSAVYQGKIYAVGGQHGHDEALVETALLDVYDPATDTWAPLADMPLAKSHIAASTFVFQGRILTLAGEISNGHYTAENAAYDFATNTWTELTPFPEAIFSGIARPLLGGFVYTTGSYSPRTWLGVPAN
jgi:N-acetylneuraminic acid mutarotase